jgi:hypothetical protein
MNVFPVVSIEYQTQSDWENSIGIKNLPKIDVCASFEKNQWIDENGEIIYGEENTVMRIIMKNTEGSDMAAHESMDLTCQRANPCNT